MDVRYASKVYVQQHLSSSIPYHLGPTYSLSASIEFSRLMFRNASPRNRGVITTSIP